MTGDEKTMAELLTEHAQLQRRLRIFRDHGIPANQLQELYARLAALEAQIEDCSLVMIWTHMEIAEA